MSLPVLIWFFLAVFLGGLAVIFSYREERLRRIMAKQEEQQRQKLSMVVHELRAPLTAIKGAAELLLGTHQQKFTIHEKEHLLTLIDQQAQELLEQVATILDAEKLASGKFTIQKRTTNLKHVITERVAFFRPQARQKGIHILVHFNGHLQNVLLDPDRVAQILNNLISNSVKFTPVGGTITVSAKRDNGKVKVAISDTGIGIPKEKQRELFRQFSQVSTMNAHNGTGLGLYIVKGIVEAHHGSVSLESEVDKGTTVSFTIPISSHLM